MRLCDVVTVLERQARLLKEMGYAPQELQDHGARRRLPDDPEPLFRHIGWMAQEVAGWGAERTAKAHRWLGWAQGVLCMAGVYTLAEEAQMNRDSSSYDDSWLETPFTVRLHPGNRLVARFATEEEAVQYALHHHIRRGGWTAIHDAQRDRPVGTVHLGIDHEAYFRTYMGEEAQ